MMNRRQFLVFGAASTSAFLCAPYALAQVSNINGAINKSGRQRMLSQRLAKCYLQIGQKIETYESKRILDVSMALFDRQLVELKAFAPSKENKQVLAKCEQVWLAYKEALVGADPERRGGLRVLQLSDEVLGFAQEATVQLTKLSGTEEGQLVNIAGRQRMLSQRMAKFYQALSWGLPAADAKANLLAARNEFSTALLTLEKSPKNTAAIASQLSLGRQQWAFFDRAIRSADSLQSASEFERAEARRNVATTSERILQVMDSATGLYSQLG